MKILPFTATLLVAFILILSLATYVNKDERKSVKFTPIEVTKLTNVRVDNPQLTIENKGINKVPVNTIDDEGGYDVQIATEFRECG